MNCLTKETMGFLIELAHLLQQNNFIVNFKKSDNSFNAHYAPYLERTGDFNNQFYCKLSVRKQKDKVVLKIFAWYWDKFRNFILVKSLDDLLFITDEDKIIIRQDFFVFIDYCQRMWIDLFKPQK